MAILRGQINAAFAAYEADKLLFIGTQGDCSVSGLEIKPTAATD